jgi:hypothetical protein
MPGFIFLRSFPSGVAQFTHKVNGDEYVKSETQVQLVWLFTQEKTMTSRIIKVESAEVNQWMATSIYTADDVLAIICVVSPISRPAIDHCHQLELQSARHDDYIDIISSLLKICTYHPLYQIIRIYESKASIWQIRTVWPICGC